MYLESRAKKLGRKNYYLKFTSTLYYKKTSFLTVRPTSVNIEKFFFYLKFQAVTRWGRFKNDI